MLSLLSVCLSKLYLNYDTNSHKLLTEGLEGRGGVSLETETTRDFLELLIVQIERAFIGITITMNLRTQKD